MGGRPDFRELQRRLAAAVREEDPTDLGPARLRALRQASPDDYYAALQALRRHEWKVFLGFVPPSKRRTALRALADVVEAPELARLERLVPAARRPPRAARRPRGKVRRTATSGAAARPSAARGARRG